MNEGETTSILRNEDLLSVVIPAFNEELVLEASIKKIRHVLEVSRILNEIIVVNDGSTDTTLDILIRLKKSGPLRIINLSSNSGHMNAIRAGLESSKGAYVVTIDADLQDPPEAIPEMFRIISSKPEMGRGGDADFFQKSYDVVQAYRIDRATDTFWKRTSAALYYPLVKKITGINVIPHAADFRIMKKHVVKTLISLPEKNLVYRLLIPSLGYKVEYFPITRGDRFAGKSKYTNRKMIGLAVDSMIGFTNRPLRFLAYFGFLASVILFFSSIGTLLLFTFGNTLPGWPSLVLLILSFNAFLFAGVGLVGEYIGRIYQLIQARPTTFWTEI